MVTFWRTLCGAIGMTVALAAQSGPGPSPLTFVRAIPLPGVEGRFDHFAFDVSSSRLFVAALGNNTVEVLDVKGAALVKTLPGFREPQGIAALPDARLMAVANGQGEGLQFLKTDNLGSASVVRLGDDADNVRYDAAAKRVYVGYGAGAIAAVDPANAKVIGEAKLPGHPESFQLERGGTRLFVNVPTAGLIAVIDRTAMKVTASWPVTSAKSNFPMALDETGHRLFVGCRNPAKVLVYDTLMGKEVGAFDIVGDTDDLFYDVARKRLYISGGEGSIDAFELDGASHASRIARVATAAGARTSLFVPELNRLFLAVPHRGSQQAEIRIYEIR